MTKHATDIAINGVNYRHLITSTHGNVTARTAIHTTNLPKRLGGVRFVERGSVEEVARLALGMSEKATAAEVPIDGLKCLIECPDGVPVSIAERAKLVIAHLRLARRVDPDIIFGPDMLAPESVLSLVASEPDLAGNVTGLTRALGGIDIDGNALTAIGVGEAILAACTDNSSQSVAIQGFGAVGAELAKLLTEDGHRITAVSNKLGLATNQAGIDIRRCYDAWKDIGDAWIRRNDVTDIRVSADIESILTMPCDVLVPAARTVVIAMRDELSNVAEENPDVVSVENVIESNPPRIIAEAANHPITDRAERALQDAGVLILPDVLINCGGMIGCWCEFVNRDALLRDEDEYDRALAECKSRISDVVGRNSLTVIAAGASGEYSRNVAESMCYRTE